MVSVGWLVELWLLVRCVDNSNRLIIDPTGMEIFAKEPKLATLLRELKPTPVSCNKKKTAGFSPMSIMANLLCFGRFSAGGLVNGCFFFTHYSIYN